MKIATWNVNGIRARKDQFAGWMTRDEPDVVCLQELKASLDQIPAEICDLAGYRSLWHGNKGYSGVSLHVRNETFPGEVHFTHPSFDHETRIVQTQLGDLVVASVYVPNGGKDFGAKMDFLQAINEYVERTHREGLSLILCGDMNVALTDRDVHPRERKPGIIGQRSDERELMEGLISRGLVDLGRTMDPENDDLFTWWAPWRNMRQRNIGWRLDYVLASQAWASRAVSCRVLSEIGTSDHAPVMAVFD
ncbi:MAG: exodeoxyribonuclease III [Acidobacteriota bacterium]